MSGVSQETCMWGKLLPLVYVCTNFLRRRAVLSGVSTSVDGEAVSPYVRNKENRRMYLGSPGYPYKI